MPYYDLADIHAAARDERIWLQGRTDLDANNLGYTLSHICECLLALSEQHFHATEVYTDKKRPCDVYKIRHRRDPEGLVDPLYIKLQIASVVRSAAVLLISFHRER
jgi:Motility quorum-sensing regulator, toxin of MqsA